MKHINLYVGKEHLCVALNTSHIKQLRSAHLLKMHEQGQ